MELMGSAEVAELAGVNHTAVNNWQRRKYLGFPKPLVTLACGPIWDRQVIEEWLANRKAKQAQAFEKRIKQLETELKRLKKEVTE